MTSAPFEQLLGALDPDRERAGAHYRQLHQRLVKFFEWECSPQPEANADVVIDRIIRRIGEGERIGNLPAYAHGVAKLVVREVRKTAQRDDTFRTELLHLIQQERLDESENDELELQRNCFDHCLQTMTTANRELILAYYAGDGRTKIEGRRDLATALGTDLNALRVRAHRIRAQLEHCIAACAGRKTGNITR
jgi:DNA-directed RNA polymerase specialized sigma24 family protein